MECQSDGCDWLTDCDWPSEDSARFPLSQASRRSVINRQPLPFLSRPHQLSPLPRRRPSLSSLPPPLTVVFKDALLLPFIMLSRTSRSVVKRRLVPFKGFATAAPRIGDTKVRMSPLEEGNYINYQRIEDNLAVVRKRSVLSLVPTMSWN